MQTNEAAETNEIQTIRCDESPTGMKSNSEVKQPVFLWDSITVT